LKVKGGCILGIAYSEKRTQECRCLRTRFQEEYLNVQKRKQQDDILFWWGGPY
jgi:hypothetical protein